MCKTAKLAALVCVLFLGTMVFAQGINDVYQVNYFSNANYVLDYELGGQIQVPVVDSTIRIINTGQQGTPISSGHGTVCADIYVFDNTQEMLECCACQITANGLLELSLKNNLLQNPLTGLPGPNSGVVKIVSDNRANCNPFSPVPVPDLRAWGTHVQLVHPLNQGAVNNLVTTEQEFADAPLQSDELSFLGQACSFVQYLGSTKGVCTCPKEVPAG